MTTRGLTSSSSGNYERSFSDAIIPMTEENPFRTFCVTCGKVGWTKKSLKLCTRCKSVAYCSRECQVKDYGYHKKKCLNLSKLKQQVQEQAMELRRLDNSISNVSHLWGLDDDTPPFAHTAKARDYVMPRGTLMHALEYECMIRVNRGGKINEIALTAAIEHRLDLMALFHESDPMGNRDGVAGCMIALRRYQQAYDFLKFWLTRNEIFENFVACIDHPFLRMKGEDMFEILPILYVSRDEDHQLDESFLDARHLMEMALLKLYLFSDIRAVQLFAQKFEFLNDVVPVVASFLHDIPGDWNKVDTSLLLFQARQLLSCVDAKERGLLAELVKAESSIDSTNMSSHGFIITWLKQNKVALNFFKNFVRDIRSSKVPVDELMAYRTVE